MASKIKVDQIEGSSGSTITIPTGQTLTVTDGIPASNLSGTIADARLPTISVTKGGTGLTSLGSAGQALKVNSGGTALEFGTAGGLVSTGFNDDTTNNTITATSFTEVTGAAFNVAMTSGQKIHLFPKLHGYQNYFDNTDNMSMFVTENGASEVNILSTATASGGMGLTRTSYQRYWHATSYDHSLSSLDGWFTWTAQTTGTHSFTIKVFGGSSNDMRCTGTTVWYMITSV